jgi:hypothetical protein
MATPTRNGNKTATKHAAVTTLRNRCSINATTPVCAISRKTRISVSSAHLRPERVGCHGPRRLADVKDRTGVLRTKTPAGQWPAVVLAIVAESRVKRVPATRPIRRRTKAKPPDQPLKLGRVTLSRFKPARFRDEKNRDGRGEEARDSENDRGAE